MQITTQWQAAILAGLPYCLNRLCMDDQAFGSPPNPIVTTVCSNTYRSRDATSDRNVDRFLIVTLGRTLLCCKYRQRHHQARFEPRVRGCLVAQTIFRPITDCAPDRIERSSAQIGNGDGDTNDAAGTVRSSQRTSARQTQQLRDLTPNSRHSASPHTKDVHGTSVMPSRASNTTAIKYRHSALWEWQRQRQ